MRKYRAAILICTTVGICQQPLMITAACAASNQNDGNAPSLGTVLLPLTPKIDENVGGNTVILPLSPKITSGSSKTAAPKITAPRRIAGKPASPAVAGTQAAAPAGKPAPTVAEEEAPIPAPRAVAPGAQPDISAESGADENDNTAAIDEKTLLKGAVQIVADDTEYDQEKNTFLGTGNAIAIIGGQNSKLEADTILFDQNNNTIDARGNVKILRNGQLTTGSSFKFKIDSDEYLITNPDTALGDTAVVARNARGTKAGLLFKNGQFTLPTPFHTTRNPGYAPGSMVERFSDEQAHADAYVTRTPSYRFTARKMIYERYKDDGNLTVFGGRLVFDNFTLPLPKFVANVGTENSRVVFPVTPLIGNNMMVGGTNIGPQFNYAVGKTGCFSWAPLVQFGGNTTTGSDTISNAGKVGAGFKVGFTNDFMTANVAYGSVTNLPVANFKYRFNKKTTFQAGANAFLSDGLFGMRRARLLSEVVDQRTLKDIPFVTGITFRTSGGWAQDDPSLVNLSGSQYSQLFSQTHTGKVSAYRMSEQITTTSHPIFAFGDQKYGVDLRIGGGVAAKAYSTGDYLLLGQLGPLLTARLGRFRGQVSYAQSGIRGQSPFVFDQFIQGSRSVSFNGDVKLTKWLTLGTNLGYNMDAKLMFTKAMTAAIGPEDFKLLFTRDFISGYQRFGFDVLYGQPVRFNKLLVKGGPDAGQTGGI